MAKTIYYLPGYGGQLGTGLGAELMRRGFGVTGRQTVGEFRDRAFADQVATVADDLQASFRDADACVVANSFGAYLFLHAQAQLPPFAGSVLLLSPILGAFSDPASHTSIVPPAADRLLQLAAAGQFPVPARCEFHVGETDWQSRPADVAAFAAPLGLPFSVVPGSGHMLDKAYVAGVLDRWLPAR